MVKGKRELVARASAAAGFTSLLQAIPKRNLLLVLNYHRIGNVCENPYDPGLISATAAEFDDQIGYLKRHFHMVTAEETVAMANGETPLRAGALVTFDDGYLDNYTLAFPVLRSHGVQGVFFLPTSFIGTARLPFWDVIAYVVRQSKKKVIRMEYPEAAVFDLERNGFESELMKILGVSKTIGDRDGFIGALAQACDTSIPPEPETRRFLNWQEAREMHRAGMAIGSHTHNHEILSRLSPEQQCYELRQSRQILEEQLATRIDILSYPDGGPSTFSAATMDALRKTGYRAAFSYYGGINRPGKLQPFDILRCSIERPSPPRFRLQTTLTAVTGGPWF